VTNDQLRAADESWQGRTVEVTIGPIAHGGHCVTRFEGRVMFVRHALPGEVVRALVTEDRGGSFCRADAVQIVKSAPERVSAPCPHAHPGGCGGCDFQHVTLAGQRQLKAVVVAEQLQRLAGLQWPVTVLPLAEEGLGWRRRIRYAVAPDGQLGLRAHRSHQVIPLDRCPLGAPGVGDAAELDQRWPGLTEVEVAADDAGSTAAIGHRELLPHSRGRHSQRGRPAAGRAVRPKLTSEHLAGPQRLRYVAGGHHFDVQAGGFWQTHPAAADAFTEAVLTAAALRPGERALDLYAGAGLFTVALAEAVTVTGAVLGLEADRTAVADASHNLREQPWASVRRAPVTVDTVTAAAAELGTIDAIVLDPPRTGAGRDVLGAILTGKPRAVVYVACDPAALARDVRTALDAGWQLTDLHAFDAFPMTHHVECIATLTPRNPAS
jgi:tRNA/tmRNA/rRNA uracil-C5-methylase (TrmA/RlmC/RlmD family)